MRTIKGLFLFYKRIVFPALLFSAVLSSFGMTLVNFFGGLGFAFLFLLPLFHYLSYEIRYPGEYYFYHNQGLSKLVLWLITLVISLLVGLGFMLI